jgi:hypothetical protein
LDWRCYLSLASGVVLHRRMPDAERFPDNRLGSGRALTIRRSRRTEHAYYLSPQMTQSD